MFKRIKHLFILMLLSLHVVNINLHYFLTIEFRKMQHYWILTGWLIHFLAVNIPVIKNTTRYLILLCLLSAYISLQILIQTVFCSCGSKQTATMCVGWTRVASYIAWVEETTTITSPKYILTCSSTLP